MIVSKITTRDIVLYLKLEPEDLTEEQYNEIDGFLTAAKNYVMSHTGLTPDQVDEHEDLSVAVFILCQEFYDNRSAYAPSSQSPSKTLECILSIHCKNFL